MVRLNRRQLLATRAVKFDSTPPNVYGRYFRSLYVTVFQKQTDRINDMPRLQARTHNFRQKRLEYEVVFRTDYQHSLRRIPAP
jgi:hypothetical protein